MARWDNGRRNFLEVAALATLMLLAGAFVAGVEHTADSALAFERRGGFSPRDTNHIIDESPDAWPQPASFPARLPSVTSSPPWLEGARLFPLSPTTLQPTFPAPTVQAESSTSATSSGKFMDGVNGIRDLETVEDGQLHKLRELHAVYLADEITPEPAICENPALAFVRSGGFSPRDTNHIIDESPDVWPQPASFPARLPSVASSPPWLEGARLFPQSATTLQPTFPAPTVQAESLTSATPSGKIMDGVDGIRDLETVEDGQLHKLRELHAVYPADKITPEPAICENPVLAFVRSGGFSPRDTNHIINESPDVWPQPASFPARLPSVTSSPPWQEVAPLWPLSATTLQPTFQAPTVQADSLTSATPSRKFMDGVDGIRDAETFRHGRTVTDVRSPPGPAPDTGDMTHRSTLASPSAPKTSSLDLVTIAEDFSANLPDYEQWGSVKFDQAELRAALDILALHLMDDSPTVEDGQLHILRELYVYLAENLTPIAPLLENQADVVATNTITGDSDATLHSDTSHGLPNHARTTVANIVQAVLLCAIIFAVVAGGARFLKNRRRPVNRRPQQPPEQGRRNRRDGTSSASPTLPVQLLDEIRSKRTEMVR